MGPPGGQARRGCEREGGKATWVAPSGSAARAVTLWGCLSTAHLVFCVCVGGSLDHSSPGQAAGLSGRRRFKQSTEPLGPAVQSLFSRMCTSFRENILLPPGTGSPSVCSRLGTSAIPCSQVVCLRCSTCGTLRAVRLALLSWGLPRPQASVPDLGEQLLRRENIHLHPTHSSLPLHPKQQRLGRQPCPHHPVHSCFTRSILGGKTRE